MPTKKLTVRFVDSIKAPAVGRVEYWDESTPGFGVRASSSGLKTWVLMYRNRDGRKRRLKLGVYPTVSLADARGAAADHLRAVAKGKDPAAEKSEARKTETFGDLAEDYIEHYAKPNKRSWKEDRRALDRDLLPRFKHRKLNDITRRELRNLLREIVDRGAPILANRTLEVMRGIYRWAVEDEVLPVNPFAGMPPPVEKRKRERVLSDAEIPLVWEALGGDDDATAARYRLQFLTAQRPGELRQMRWPDLDLDAGWWTIPGDITKNGRAHRLPLVRLAVAILCRLGAGECDPVWVFPSPTAGGPIRSNTKSSARIRKASGVDFTPHDIRRTIATNLTGMGFSRFLVGRLLNHTDPSVTGTYDLYEYDREKAKMLEAWAEHLAQLIAGKKAVGGKVVQLRPA